MRVDDLAEDRGTDPAVLFEQRDEQVVLAGEARVEALERHPRVRTDLLHGEGGAAGLVGEVAGRADEALEPSDRPGAGTRERTVERPVAPGSIGRRLGERDSPSLPAAGRSQPHVPGTSPAQPRPA